MSDNKDIEKKVKCWNCGKDLIEDNKLHLCVTCMVTYVGKLVAIKKAQICPRYLLGTKTIVKENLDPDTGNKIIETKEEYIYRKCDENCGLYAYRPDCCKQ